MEYLVPSINSKMKEKEGRKRLGITKIISKLRSLKKEGDKEDVGKARNLYPDPAEFSRIFSYRKGSKDVPLKQHAQIARKYRQITEEVRFWNFEDEKDEEEPE